MAFATSSKDGRLNGGAACWLAAGLLDANWPDEGAAGFGGATVGVGGLDTGAAGAAGFDATGADATGWAGAGDGGATGFWSRGTATTEIFFGSGVFIG